MPARKKKGKEAMSKQRCTWQPSASSAIWLRKATVGIVALQ